MNLQPPFVIMLKKTLHNIHSAAKLQNNYYLCIDSKENISSNNSSTFKRYYL